MLPGTLRLAAVAALLAVAAVAAAPAPAAADAEGESRTCREVHFTPSSDDVAGGIRVRDVSCRYARAFIRETRGRPPRSHRGWRCRSRTYDPDMGLRYTVVRCTRGERVMRWEKT